MQPNLPSQLPTPPIFPTLLLSPAMDIDPLPNGNGNGNATAIATVDSANNITCTGVSAHAPSSKPSGLQESLKLEHQFLRVPFEHYKKTIRINHRSVEKEVSAVISAVDSSSSDLSRDDAVSHFSSIVSRIHGLKRKLEEGSHTENMQAQRCRARLDHLESANADNLSSWNNTRLKRILVDYMLRMSYYNSAIKLAETRNLQSKLEFQLRLQEFIELVRADNSLLAIKYARKYLAPWGATHMKELQRVVATLAFKSSTECGIYKQCIGKS